MHKIHVVIKFVLLMERCCFSETNEVKNLIVHQTIVNLSRLFNVKCKLGNHVLIMYNNAKVSGKSFSNHHQNTFGNILNEMGKD